MVLRPDGGVGAHRAKPDHRHRLTGGRLSFHDMLGRETSAARYSPDHGGFDPVEGSTRWLRPILSLGPPPERSAPFPPVFVNTAPKAGTYLTARALEIMGMRSVGLHAMDHFLHDNRGVPEDEIHYEPALRHVDCPARAVAAMMRPGEFAVGHLSQAGQIRAVAANGALVLNIVREPRSMFASMFVFKREKVKPAPEDAAWRAMEGVESFREFLKVFPVEHLLAQLRIMTRDFRVIRYEDLRRGRVALGWRRRRFARALAAAVREAEGQKTSTYIPRERGSAAELMADPWVRRFFEEAGVNEISRKYWPELN